MNILIINLIQENSIFMHFMNDVEFWAEKRRQGVNFIKLERTAYGVKRKSAKVERLRQSVNFFWHEFHQPISWQQICASRKLRGKHDADVAICAKYVQSIDQK